MKNGTSQNKIATALHRSQGTISKETARNKGKRGYRHKQADRTAKERHQIKAKSIKLTEKIRQFIENELKANQSSPEQITGRFKIEQGISSDIVREDVMHAVLELNLRPRKVLYNQYTGDIVLPETMVKHKEWQV